MNNPPVYLKMCIRQDNVILILSGLPKMTFKNDSTFKYAIYKIATGKSKVCLRPLENLYLQL